MDQEQIRRIIDSPDEYDSSREEGVVAMLKDFYSRRMFGTALLVWAGAIIFCAGAAYSAFRFFDADQTKWQIVYAALFVCFFHGVGLMKVFAWQMVSKLSIRREIKRLELRVAELTEVVKDK